MSLEGRGMHAGRTVKYLRYFLSAFSLMGFWERPKSLLMSLDLWKETGLTWEVFLKMLGAEVKGLPVP